MSLLALNSALPALYTHAHSSKPSYSATKIVTFLQNQYNQTKANPVLAKMYQEMLHQAYSVYHLNDKIVREKIFTAVENRRLDSISAILDHSPEVFVELGSGYLSVFMDVLQALPKAVGVGLELPENVLLAEEITTDIFPNIAPRTSLFAADLTNSEHLLEILQGFVYDLSATARMGKMVIYNQGLFRYIDKALHYKIAETMFQIACLYPDEVVWVQADNEFLTSSVNVAAVNNTQSNVWNNVGEMLDIFSSAGWQYNWNGKTLVLHK